MTMLKRLLPSQDIDALLGDIAEEAPRRSRLWYWSQILAAVVVASWQDVRKHPVLAGRATATGLLALAAFFYPVSVLRYLVRVTVSGGHYVGPYWLTLPQEALYVLPIIANPIGFGVSGWVVARVHRAHGLTLVLPYVALVCALPYWAIAQPIVSGVVPVARMHLAIVSAGMISTLSLPAFVVLGAALALKS